MPPSLTSVYILFFSFRQFFIALLNFLKIPFAWITPPRISNFSVPPVTTQPAPLDVWRAYFCTTLHTGHYSVTTPADDRIHFSAPGASCAMRRQQVRWWTRPSTVPDRRRWCRPVWAGTGGSTPTCRRRNGQWFRTRPNRWEQDHDRDQTETETKPSRLRLRTRFWPQETKGTVYKISYDLS